MLIFSRSPTPTPIYSLDETTDKHFQSNFGQEFEFYGILSCLFFFSFLFPFLFLSFFSPFLFFRFLISHFLSFHSFFFRSPTPSPIYSSHKTTDKQFQSNFGQEFEFYGNDSQDTPKKYSVTKLLDPVDVPATIIPKRREAVIRKKTIIKMRRKQREKKKIRNQ